jgi:hypothetical protein
VKKPGQPASPLEITAGRKTLLGAFRFGIADREQMAMAANWLRDLTVFHGESLKRLEGNPVYLQLMRGTLTGSATQNHAADWIEGLVQSGEIQPMVEQPTANERQVGGAHYRKKIQHWDFVASHDYGYLEGQVTKYVFRWKDKNGLQDVQKAEHFLQKLIEVAEMDSMPIPLGQFLDDNDIQGEEREIYIAMHAYHGTLDPMFLEVAQRAMKRLLASAAALPPA